MILINSFIPIYTYKIRRKEKTTNTESIGEEVVSVRFRLSRDSRPGNCAAIRGRSRGFDQKLGNSRISN